MEYQHSFVVHAPLAEVSRFHRRMDSFKALNPPPIIVKLHKAADNPSSGDQMDFTLWLGPLPIRWVAEFSQVSSQGFTDTQIRGPFEKWVHQHRFQPIGDHATEVVDILEVEIGLKPLFPVAFFMWLSLPLLFGYRAWQTKRLLEIKSKGDHESEVVS